MSKQVGIGQFLAWDGGCVFLGRHDRSIPVHAHHAMQLLVASEGDHRVRASDAEPWRTHSLTAIPSRHPHSIDVTDSPYGAVIFVEPETREGRAIAQRYCSSGITDVGTPALRELTRSVFAEALAGRREETIRMLRLVVSTLADGVEPAVVTDPRILSAIAYINAHIARPISLDEVASHACLSPSRFRHLFSEETGMGLRPFVLWKRFLLTWDLLMQGVTLSEAAHAAGFADAAHLSRTSVRYFAFAPSAMRITPSLPEPKVRGAEASVGN